ncbi:MAG TPA: SRPBCC domain-containing protein [Alphaproteobacteria bacterium]|jgi:uncharacterized protein YndB with AHSA1/START domain
MAKAAAAAPAASERPPQLRIEREFKAPPERVFAAFTDPKLFAEWWGPEGMSCPVCEIDPRVGGRWRTCMRGVQGEHWVSGVYREIVRPRRLVFTWAWEENGVRGHETLVEIEFLPAGRNTKLVLNHTGFETADSRDKHVHGWDSCFACLDRFLKGE